MAAAPGWSHLTLRGNQLTDVGATELLTCVANYHKLLFLDLSDNLLTSAVQQAAFDMAQKHPYFVRCDLGVGL